MPLKINSSELASCTVLWRYVPFINLVNILEFNLLRFSSIASFRNFDRHEAHLLKDYIQQWKALPNREADSRDSEPNTNNLNIAAHMVHACCFHENPEESVLMWNSYPNAQVAIKTTVENLQQTFPNNQNSIQISRIRYGDTCAEVGILVSKDILGVRSILNTKRKGYAHEKEVRLWYLPVQNEHISGQIPEAYKVGVRELLLRRRPTTSDVSIQGISLIQAVAISPQLRDGYDRIIHKYLNKHKIEEIESAY